MDASLPALHARDVAHVYRRGIGRCPVIALHPLSLDLPPGRVFGLIGPNGSGKSTLVKIAAGLLRPTAGRLDIFGHEAGSRPALAALGYLPENVRLPSHLTGRETLDFFAALSGVPRAERSGRVEEGLERFSLRADAHRYVGEYSKGMAQKIGILQAMLHRPRLLLFDEPTAGLDPRGQEVFFGMVKELGEDGVTVLLLSHLLANVEAACTHAAILHQGRLLRTGSVEEITGLRRLFDVRLGTDGPADPAEVEGRLARAGFQVEDLRPAARSLRDVFLEISSEEPGDEDASDCGDRIS